MAGAETALPVAFAPPAEDGGCMVAVDLAIVECSTNHNLYCREAHNTLQVLHTQFKHDQGHAAGFVAKHEIQARMSLGSASKGI